jgi:hypothetical protein
MAIDGRRLKRTQIGTRPLASLPQHPHLMLVTSNSKGSSILPMLMELTHLPRVSLVLSGSTPATAIVAMMVR